MRPQISLINLAYQRIRRTAPVSCAAARRSSLRADRHFPFEAGEPTRGSKRGRLPATGTEGIPIASSRECRDPSNGVLAEDRLLGMSAASCRKAYQPDIQCLRLNEKEQDCNPAIGITLPADGTPKMPLSATNGPCRRLMARRPSIRPARCSTRRARPRSRWPYRLAAARRPRAGGAQALAVVAHGRPEVPSP